MPRVEFTEGTWDGRPRRFRPDQVLLKLKDGLSPQDVATSLRRIRRRLAATGTAMRIGRWFAFRIDPAAGVPQSIENLLADPQAASAIEFAEPDFLVRPTSTVATATAMPNDPYLVDPGDADEWQWGLPRMGMDVVWSLQRGNGTVLPVVVDSGVEAHQDLDAGRLLYGGNFVGGPAAGTTFVPDGVFTAAFTEGMTDEHGHGLEMTGIVAATADNGKGVAGMNWESSVGICRVFDDTGTGLTSAVLAGVAQSVQRGKITGENIVVNLSLVLEDIDVDRTRFPGAPVGSKTLEYACALADANGVILVCGGGNDGGTEPGAPAVYAATYPDHVIAVGITYLDGVGGDEKVMTAASHEGITVVAPGNNWPVLDLSPTEEVSTRYQVSWGSSISAAHVTGLASLLWSHRPHLAGKEIVRVLKETAYRPAGVAVGDKDWGWGRIDGSAAINALDKTVVVSMVLDKSGSMAGASGTAGMTRMEVLQAATDILVHSLGSRSHVGVIGFDTGAMEVFPAQEIDPDDPDAVMDEVSARVAALAPGGSTSIGAGVEAGSAQVTAVPDGDIDGEPARGVLLFTDGRENTAPFVLGEPSVDWSVITGQVHSVATGTSDVVDIDALDELASRTHGSWAATGNWDEESEQAIAKFFIQSVTTLVGDEPVLDPVGTIRPSDGTVAIEFPLTEDDRRVEVLLMRPNGAELSLALRTPSGDVISPELIEETVGAKYHESGRVVAYRLELPSRAEGRDPAHEGIWTALLEVTEKRTTVPPGGARYTLLVNALSRLRLRTALRQSGTAPGAKLELSAAVTRAGSPAGIDEMEASVEVKAPNGPVGSRRLPQRGQGSFRGRTTLPREGVYRIKLQVEGLVDDRPFRRERLLSAATWTETPDPGDGIPARSDPDGPRNSS